jgi:hypothetical protein
MVMNNLTTFKFGREKFLNASENPDLKAFMIENLIAMTEFFKDQDIFNFGANVSLLFQVLGDYKLNNRCDPRQRPVRRSKIEASRIELACVPANFLNDNFSKEITSQEVLSDRRSEELDVQLSQPLERNQR